MTWQISLVEVNILRHLADAQSGLRLSHLYNWAIVPAVEQGPAVEGS